MAFQASEEFETALAQLCRFYRAQREMYGSVAVDDQRGVTRWVSLGGKLMDKMDEVLSDIEVYSGTSELRVITSELKQMRAAKDSAAEKA